MLFNKQLQFIMLICLYSAHQCTLNCNSFIFNTKSKQIQLAQINNGHISYKTLLNVPAYLIQETFFFRASTVRPTLPQKYIVNTVDCAMKQALILLMQWYITNTQNYDWDEMLKRILTNTYMLFHWYNWPTMWALHNNVWMAADNFIFTNSDNHRPAPSWHFRLQ